MVWHAVFETGHGQAIRAVLTQLTSKSQLLGRKEQLAVVLRSCHLKLSGKIPLYGKSHRSGALMAVDDVAKTAQIRQALFVTKLQDLCTIR